MREILVIGIFGDGGTRRGFCGEDTLNFEVCECLSAGTALCQQNKKCQNAKNEIRTENWVLYVCYYEYTRQCTPESKVEGERLFTIRANWRIVNSCEGQFIWWMFAAVEEGGTTLTSECVSTKERVCVCKSLMKNRRLGHWLGAFVAANVREFSQLHGSLHF